MLSPRELEEVYTAIVSTSGHPDPLGYMARILLTSGGEPNYVDVGGKLGIMPVTPDYALESVGASDVQSLQGNIIATLAMDIQLYAVARNIEKMIIQFHDGLDASSASEETQGIIDGIPETRQAVVELMFPRRATIEDVIDMLSVAGETTLTPKMRNFFGELRGTQ